MNDRRAWAGYFLLLGILACCVLVACVVVAVLLPVIGALS